MCRQFAKRGFVAVSIDYRLGWNPVSSDQDVRTGTLLRAVYRALQDTRTCVRYFKNNIATGGNTYNVDSTQIIIGGQGSGGYIAWALATLDTQSKILIPKFIDIHGNSYVNDTILGDIWGFGGSTDTSNADGGNIVNYPNNTSNVALIFNMGGALGDSSWLDAHSTPAVAFHVPSDPFAPYTTGTVIVPTTHDPVVDVWGSYTAMHQADLLGINSIYNSRVYNDNYTLRANSVNDGILGLLPYSSDPVLMLTTQHLGNGGTSMTCRDKTSQPNLRCY